MTEWLCAFCGFLNEEEIRVAAKTLCMRCHKEKRDPGELRAELSSIEADLERNIDRVKGRLAELKYQRACIENEVAEVQAKIRKINDEAQPYIEELHSMRERLTQIREERDHIHTTPVKTIYPDQATLIHPEEA